MSSVVLSSVAFMLLASSETSAATYPAPTSWEAHEAFNAKVEELVLSSREGLSGSKDVTTTASWAINFDIVNCRWGREPTLNAAAEGIPENQGYLCMIQVLPYEGDGFVTRGFLVHDRTKWRYFGWLERSDGFHKKLFLGDQVVQGQPYVDTPYLNTQSVQYKLRGPSIVDNSPWRRPSESLYHEDIDNLESQGANDPLINAYERFNTPYREDYDDLLRYPKGTKHRNERGY